MEKKFCQSCGMPMDENAQWGLNGDGSASEDYCGYCYRDGKFAQDCTMEEMIDFCIPYVAKECHVSKDEARKEMLEFFPQLKRWKSVK